MAAKGSQKAPGASQTASDPYYDALIAAWNNPTQPPPGVTGEALLAADTTDQKIVKVNNWTVREIPSLFLTLGADMLNCIDWAEFAALQSTEQANVLGMCGVSGQLKGGLDAASLITGGMFVAYFPLNGPTIAALTKLAEVVQPWWQASIASGGGGLSSPINEVDVAAAGLE